MIIIFFIATYSCFSTYAQNCDDKGMEAFDKGRNLMDQKKYLEAVLSFKIAISNWSDCLNSPDRKKEVFREKVAIAYYRIGVCYRLLEQPEKAIDAYMQTIQYTTKFAEGAYRRLGDTHYSLKQYDQAEEAYRNVIRINPNNGVAYVSIGSIYRFIRGDGNTALYFYEKALTLSFDDSDYNKMSYTIAEAGVKRLKEQGYSSSNTVISSTTQTATSKSTSTTKTNQTIPLIQMVYVQGGTFTMGATSEQGTDAESDEKPVHKVSLSDYCIGKYEVTQAQWVTVMGTTVRQQRDKGDPSWSLFAEGDNYPMYYVSYDEVQEFIRKLNEKTGSNYRLPTEAEWEFAARGGIQCSGHKYSGSSNVDNVAWLVIIAAVKFILLALKIATNWVFTI